MAKYPIYLEMSGRRVVVIGGGAVAARKTQTLARAGARVVVVAPVILPALEEAFQYPDVQVVLGPYRKDYLVGATLAIAATNDMVLNRQIFEDCQELEVLCNVVDQPDLCDFFVPAIVRRGELQIAVGTDGHCPAYAGHIRRKLEEIFTDTHGRFVDELKQVRLQLLRDVSDPDRRKALLGILAGDESFEIFERQGPGPWREYAERMKHSVLV